VCKTLVGSSSSCGKDANNQWEFQDPKMGVPTIYKAYVSGLCKEIYPQKYGQKYGTNVPPF